MKTVAILGSTGSVGQNALNVIARLKDEFKVIGLASGRNSALLAKQINKFHPHLAAIMDEDSFPGLKEAVRTRTRLFAGEQGIEAVASCKADIVVMAIGAGAALLPTLKSLEATKRLALANKESLVMAGQIIMRKAKAHAVEIIPIDSEHSAIFQCIHGESQKGLEKISLTGTGGPLKDIAKDKLALVEPDFALRHPHWKMGKKISIDSATLMNKGLEIIEAHHLFGLRPEKIEVLIHPEAVVHSLVQFIDGSVLAQLGATDMRIPIQYALTFPERKATRIARVDLARTHKLTFQKPDLHKFPCLALAMQVAKSKGLAPVVLCAADEECVSAYLSGKIKITDFARIIEDTLSRLKDKVQPSLKEILETDQWARFEVRKSISFKGVR